MITLTDEQVELLEKFTESLKKDEGFLNYVCSLVGLDKDEPSLAGLFSYAERFIRTQRGIYNGSWSGPSGPYDLTISFTARQEKATT